MVNKFGAQMLHILIKVTRANFFANSNKREVGRVRREESYGIEMIGIDGGLKCCWGMLAGEDGSSGDCISFTVKYAGGTARWERSNESVIVCDDSEGSLDKGRSVGDMGGSVSGKGRGRRNVREGGGLRGESRNGAFSDKFSSGR
jgi:hypothetical protein